MNLAIIPAHALENNTLGIHVHQEGNIQITTITGEENIRRYQEAMGEEYEPNLVAIQQRIQISSTINSTTSSGGLSPTFIIPEHEIRNKVVSSYTDFSNVIGHFRRPAGLVSINETVSLSTTYTADAGISVEFLELKLGFSLSETREFQILWKEKYDHPVIIRAYPVYEKITGEVWDADVLFDDKIGEFTVLRPLGDAVYVYLS